MLYDFRSLTSEFDVVFGRARFGQKQEQAKSRTNACMGPERSDINPFMRAVRAQRAPIASTSRVCGRRGDTELGHEAVAQTYRPPAKAELLVVGPRIHVSCRRERSTDVQWSRGRGGVGSGDRSAPPQIELRSFDTGCWHGCLPTRFRRGALLSGAQSGVRRHTDRMIPIKIAGPPSKTYAGL